MKTKCESLFEKIRRHVLEVNVSLLCLSFVTLLVLSNFLNGILVKNDVIVSSIAETDIVDVEYKDFTFFIFGYSN